LCGVLTQDALVRGLSAQGPGAEVRALMADPPAPLAAGMPVVDVLEKLDASARLLPVVEGGRLVGIVTADNVFELLRFRSALESSAQSAAQSAAHPVRS
jgi:CBS domain-containing protein